MAIDPRSPDFSSIREFLTPERIELLKSDSDRVALIREVSAKLASDPNFMTVVETMLREPHRGRSLEGFEPTTFGWTPSPDLPSPRAAAAAVAAAVVPMAVAPAAVPA
jgi:hypothetical protein